jgi:subfamily B ATP-binding cassette protein MsbA
MTTAVRDTLTVIALLALLLYYNWQLTLLTLLIAPLIALVLRRFSGRLRRLSLENQAMLGEMTRAVQEAHEGSRVIKVYDGFDYERGRFAAINDKLRRFSMKMQAAWAAGTPLTQLIAATGLSIVIATALWQARTAQLSPGEFVTFLAAAMLLLPALRGLAGLNGPLARMLAAGESVFAMIDSGVEEDRGTRTLERARGRIEFQTVSFAYPGAAGAAVEHVNLHVAPGEMIALVGPSGAGKTTIINLIPRFISPSSGRIRSTASTCRSFAWPACAARSRSYRRTWCCSTTRSPPTSPMAAVAVLRRKRFAARPTRLICCHSSSRCRMDSKRASARMRSSSPAASASGCRSPGPC